MCLNHSCSDNVSYIIINWTPDFGNILEGSAYFKLQSLSYFLKHVFPIGICKWDFSESWFTYSYLIVYSIFTKASTEVPGFSVNSSPADHDFSSEMVIHIKRMCTLQWLILTQSKLLDVMESIQNTS